MTGCALEKDGGAVIVGFRLSRNPYRVATYPFRWMRSQLIGILVLENHPPKGTMAADRVILRVDSHGGVVWKKTCRSTDNTWATGVAVTSTGKLVVIGEDPRGKGLVQEVSPEGGFGWTHIMDGGKSQHGRNSVHPTAVTACPEGGVLVAGWQEILPAGTFRLLRHPVVIRLSQDGRVAWSRSILAGATQWEEVADAKLGANGEIYLVGSSGYGQRFEKHLAVWKLGASGELIWKATDSATAFFSFGTTLLPDGKGGAVASGAAFPIATHLGADGYSLRYGSEYRDREWTGRLVHVGADGAAMGEVPLPTSSGVVAVFPWSGGYEVLSHAAPHMVELRNFDDRVWTSKPLKLNGRVRVGMGTGERFLVVGGSASQLPGTVGDLASWMASYRLSMPHATSAGSAGIPAKEGTVTAIEETGAPPMTPIRRFRHEWGDVSAKFSSDGRHLMTWSCTGPFVIWDVDQGTVVQKLPGSIYFLGHCLWYTQSPDGRYALTATKGGTSDLVDLRTGKVLRTVAWDQKRISRAAITPDLKYIVAMKFPGTAELRDAQSGRLVRTFPSKDVIATSMACSGNGELVAAAGSTCTRIWRVSSGSLLKTIAAPGMRVSGMRFTPDGKRILVTSFESPGAVTLWDLGTGRVVRTVEGFGRGAFSAAISPDGRWALTACFDQKARLWELATGSVVRSFPAYANENMANDHATGFSADGRRVFVVAERDCVDVWDVSDLAVSDRGVEGSGSQASGQTEALRR